MATINHTVQEVDQMGQGYKLLTWTGITNSSSQDWATVAGWLIVSVDWEGTPGATPSFQVHVTNNLSGGTITSGGSISTFTATAVGWIGCGNALISAGKIQPVLASGGDGTTNMNCYILLVRGS